MGSVNTAAVHCAALPEVLAWSDDGRARMDFSPLAGRSCLLFHAQAAGIPPSARERLAAWLQQLPCPTIGVAGAETDDIVARACDVVLADVSEAAPLVVNVERSPIAAAVLVQVLRATATLPPADALTVESLAYATLQAGPEFRRWLETRRAGTSGRQLDGGPAVVLRREGDHLDLELNRPSNRNAMSVEMRDGLTEALQLVLSDDSIRSVRIAGRGKCFSTGGDLAEFGTAPDPATAHLVRGLSAPGRLLAQCADRAEAYVHGAGIGSGIEFPAFARRLTAAADAYFQLPELRFGLIPGAGGCVGIARRIGRRRTAYLALSGRRINARTALEWGLVDAVAG